MPIHQLENESKLASRKESYGGKGILDVTPECGSTYSPFPTSHQCGLESSTVSLQYSLAVFSSSKWRLQENPLEKSPGCRWAMVSLQN